MSRTRENQRSGLLFDKYTFAFVCLWITRWQLQRHAHTHTSIQEMSNFCAVLLILDRYAHHCFAAFENLTVVVNVLLLCLNFSYIFFFSSIYCALLFGFVFVVHMFINIYASGTWPCARNSPSSGWTVYVRICFWFVLIVHDATRRFLMLAATHTQPQSKLFGWIKQ